MPANVRIRCKFIDCKFLNGLFCGNAEVELRPKQFCLTYAPVDLPQEEEVEEDLDEEELEESWLDEEGEEEEEEVDNYVEDEE